MRKTTHGFTLVRSANVNHSGFTLVELLVVVAIIAILAAVVIITLQPFEFLKRSRDANRLTDLANLQQAITLALSESSESANTVTCNGEAGECNGNSITGSRNKDGSGWVKINLTAQKSLSIPTLPIDPANPNTAANHYTYCGNGSNWMIETALESDQQKSKMETDGGPSDSLYEVGSDMSMSCTY